MWEYYKTKQTSELGERKLFYPLNYKITHSLTSWRYYIISNKHFLQAIRAGHPTGASVTFRHFLTSSFSVRFFFTPQASGHAWLINVYLFGNGAQWTRDPAQPRHLARGEKRGAFGAFGSYRHWPPAPIIHRCSCLCFSTNNKTVFSEKKRQCALKKEKEKKLQRKGKPLKMQAAILCAGVTLL